MYRFIGTENLIVMGNGELYALVIESPVRYETPEAAEKDCTGYRLIMKDGSVKLIVYPTEWSVTETLEDGRRVLRPIAAGTPIAEYTAADFLKNPINRLLKYIPPDERDPETRVTENGFAPCDADLTFDDLFPLLDEGSSVYVSKSKESYIEKYSD